MKYDQEHTETPGMLKSKLHLIQRAPEVGMTTHSGDPRTVHVPAPPTPAEPAPVSAGEATGAIQLEKVTGDVPAGAKVMTPSGAKPDDAKKPDDTKKPDDAKKPDPNKPDPNKPDPNKPDPNKPSNPGN
jgi:hypothetical protein